MNTPPPPTTKKESTTTFKGLIVHQEICTSTMLMLMSRENILNPISATFLKFLPEIEGSHSNWLNKFQGPFKTQSITLKMYGCKPESEISFSVPEKVLEVFHSTVAISLH